MRAWPLNRQADRYALEGAPIALSTMVDAVGAVSAALDPSSALLIQAHVMAAWERLHGDDSVLRKHAERMICMVGSLCAEFLVLLACGAIAAATLLMGAYRQRVHELNDALDQSRDHLAGQQFAEAEAT